MKNRVYIGVDFYGSYCTSLPCHSCKGMFVRGNLWEALLVNSNPDGQLLKP